VATERLMPCATCRYPVLVDEKAGPPPWFCPPHVRRGDEGGVDNRGTLDELRAREDAEVAEAQALLGIGGRV
jgi:hypothetical protein